MNKSLLYIILIAVLGFMACQREDLALQIEERVVVQGILTGGASEPTVKISRLNSANNVQSAEPISSASVQIKSFDEAYKLDESLMTFGTYQYAGNDFVGLSGVDYELEVLVEGQLLEGTAFIPPAIEIILMANQNIEIDPDDPDVEVFEMAWNEEPGYSYVFDLVLLDEDSVEIPFSVTSGLFDLFYALPQLVQNINLRARDFQFYGDHKLDIYRISRDYEEVFFFTPGLDHSANAGPDNITGGSGFFTGVSKTSITLNVTEM